MLKTLFRRKDLREDKDLLRDGVRRAYSAAAEDPSARHSFPVGRRFAESVGYGKGLLDSLPAGAAETFAGVSNVSVFADLPEGATVLDIGCGGGLDSLVAASRGSRCAVTGVDFSEAMVARARQSAAEAGLAAEFRCCGAEELPVPSATVDVILANGIFNLNPRRQEIFREMFRVLREGGAVFAAELVFQQARKKKPVKALDDWFA